MIWLPGWTVCSEVTAAVAVVYGGCPLVSPRFLVLFSGCPFARLPESVASL